MEPSKLSNLSKRFLPGRREKDFPARVNRKSLIVNQKSFSQRASALARKFFLRHKLIPMLNLSSLNPQQRLAAETLKGPVLILAGAGTGKTRVITFRIAHLIERGIAPGNILGVTFTNKAAREMQERVRKLIPKPRNPKSDEKPERLTICTFHSLCVRILRQHIEKLGYKRNFVIYDESEQISAIKKILAQISAKGEKTDPAAILGLLSKFKNGGERASVFSDPSVRAMAEHIRS